MTNKEILFSELPGASGNIGVITLNRPQVLNSINLAMVQAMLKQLRAWEGDTAIKAIVIRASEGRAFCAGGDLRSSYANGRLHEKEMAEFFRDEYTLNKTIFHFSKPYIAFLDGITMGGGVGISIHGSHRVATEKLLFAMPETGIGFFPDVGGTYFLPRLTGKMGYYLGLTGARLGLEDSIAVGVVTHHVGSAYLDSLLTKLAETPFSEEPNLAVSKIISSCAAETKPSMLMLQQKTIDTIFAKQSIEEMMTELKKSTDDFCLKIHAELLKKSPTSLKVTLLAMQKGGKLEFDEVMQQEFRLSCRFLQGHDFPEGIRAVIIDKDQNPQWQPALLSHVNEKDVANYFTPVTCELA